jgi:glycolate oxidase iron-sulfur subunit
VDYSALIDTSRSYIETHYRRPLPERLFRSFLLFVLTRPKWFAALTGASRWFAPILTHFPGKLGVMSRKARVGERKRVDWSLPDVSAGAARVLLLPGCVQRALAPGIDAAAARVLAREDMRVERLERSGCCGALAYHLGKAEIGKDYARKIIRAYEEEDVKRRVDAVLITASGCSAFLKDYPRVFADEPAWKARAEAFATKVQDFTELAKPAIKTSDVAAAVPMIAFHPPCTLQHGQKISGRGEALLAAAGFRLAPIPDAHLCCGSAGSYSLLQPEIAEQLRARKLAAIRSTEAEIIASANIGCLTHLAGELPTVHIAELLDWAGGGQRPEFH